MKLATNAKARFCPLARVLSLVVSSLACVGINYVTPAQAFPERAIESTTTASTVYSSDIAVDQPQQRLTVHQTVANSTFFLAQSVNVSFRWVPWMIGGGVLLLLSPMVGRLGGLVIIHEKEVGIVIKKFASRSLTAGQLIALNGESGYQADTLAPGWHWRYWPWQYQILKEGVVVIPQDEIGLIVANDGDATPPERILGKVVECNNFQDARQFLLNGGEKGRQLDFLTSGTYRINTALFTVITARNAAQHDMTPGNLKVYTVQPDMVGIVTTYDGMPIEEGDIAGPIIPDHDSFQNGQKFIDGGGRRGLQEQIILSGSWNLNPWFVQVEQVPMTKIPIGYVGVVISFIGHDSKDVSGESFTYGNIVNVGEKGVWLTPLYPGKHALNTRIMSVEKVPTTNIVLNFSYRQEEHGYDSKLNALNVLSKDGFSYEIEIGQVIHVGTLDAPKVISQVGSMQNLVDHVLRPIIRNYFRNSTQAYTVLEFVNAREARQAEAAGYIRQALRVYDVQGVDTLLGAIFPPTDLMKTLTDRKMAEEQQKTYEVQCNAQTKRRELVRETSLADIQADVVKADQGVRIAELQASAQIKQASGEAESIRMTGQAKADAYRAGVDALGAQAYAALQMMQVVGDRHVRVVPDVSVSSGSAGLVDGLLGMMMWNQSNGRSQAPASNGQLDSLTLSDSESLK
jgi:uncharacterized membrane protein YqiK